jgi:hypothetical protein
LKIIIQITVAALIIIACARGGEAAWRYYEFKDAVEQEIRFGTAKTVSQLLNRVVELAAEYEVGVDAEDVTIEPRPGQTVVSVSYVEPINLVPVIYTRNQQFSFELTVPAVRPLIIEK